MVTTQTADSVLKSYYLGAIAEQIDQKTNPFLARIKKTNADIYGRDIRKVIKLGINGGIGAGTEEGNLPSATGNNYVELVAPLKNLYGKIEITDKAIRASQNNEGAFVNLLNDEMEGLVKASSFNLGRMLFGASSGTLATVTVDSAGSTLTVDSVRKVVEGMVVDIYGGTTLLAQARTITAVDRKNSRITVSGGALTATKNNTIHMQGSKSLELCGLETIFGSGELYGQMRTDKAWLVPQSKTNVGDLTENVIQTVIDSVEECTNSKINFIICSWGVRRALVEILSKYRTCESLELEGGFKAISFNGIPVVADRFCPAGTMYLLNTDDFALHQLCDWQWLEGEDGKILKQVAGKPVYTATLVKYAELMCYRPCGQAKLTGITEK